MNEQENANGAQTPCISLLGLSVHHKEDGCWMRFKASNGREACINLNAYADDHGNIIGAAIRQWIEDVRPNGELTVTPAEAAKAPAPELPEVEPKEKPCG